MRATILIVDDEEGLRLTIGDRLRTAGYCVDCATNGDDGLEKATRLHFDLIILDLMLPRRDGLLVCREIRRAGHLTPILMLTARSLTQDKVLGLKTGADDYITKPFSMQELMARIEALLRRASRRESTHADAYGFGAIRVDRRGTTVTRAGDPVDMSAREFKLLQYFMDHPDVTLSREHLLAQVWGYNAAILTRTVDVHVASLRRKLERDPKHPMFIHTIQRLGYKFTPRTTRHLNPNDLFDHWHG